MSSVGFVFLMKSLRHSMFYSSKENVKFEAPKMKTRKITSKTAIATANQVSKDGEKLFILNSEHTLNGMFNR